MASKAIETQLIIIYSKGFAGVSIVDVVREESELFRIGMCLCWRVFTFYKPLRSRLWLSDCTALVLQ